MPQGPCETFRSSPSVQRADSKVYGKTHLRFWWPSRACRYESRCPVVTLRGSEIPLVFTSVRFCRRAPSTIGVAAIAAGMLTVACGSNGTTAPTTSTTTTTTTTSSAANSGGGGSGHHEKHDSGGGGGAAPAPADTGAPSTVTNTETDIQTTVQTSIATSTQTVTATPTYQQRDQSPRSDNNGNRSQFGPQQGH